MKITIYNALLIITILWQTYLMIPDKAVIGLYQTFPTQMMLLLLTDTMILGLLVTALIKDHKQSENKK